MTKKIFTERLNQELDALGAPQLMTERVQACSKLFELPRYQAHALLTGINGIDSDSIEKVAEILEVKTEWLMGIESNNQIH